MHLFRSHKDRPGMFRGHAKFELPDNPICWLTGHHPKVEVIDSRFAGMQSWVKVTCRVCGRRYQEDPDMVGSIAKSYNTPELARELVAARVGNARHDPKQYAAGINRRRGWWANDAGVNVEAHWWGFDRRKIADNLGFRIHLGDTGSETPYDFYVGAGVASAYLTVETNGRLAEVLGRGHKRDLSVKVHDGAVWWKVWYDGDGGYDEHHRCDSWRQPKLWPWSRGRRKYRGWMCLRDGNLDLNPATALWDRPKCRRVELEKKSAFVEPTPGERYLVEFTLQREVRSREHGPAWARRVLSDELAVSWDARPGGIPVRNDSWKGDEILAGSGGPPVTDRDRWLEEAVTRLEEMVRDDRARYGYVPPKREEVSGG